MRRRCPRCKRNRLLRFFSGTSVYCKPCAKSYNEEREEANPDKFKKERHERYEKNKLRIRRSRLWRKFKITPEEYDELLKKQNGVCAICSGRDEKKELAVDHDHTTGKIRGLLCSNCNPGIGFMKDSIELLEKAIAYLKERN